MQNAGRRRPGSREWGIFYRLGLDGISLFMVLLTALLLPLIGARLVELHPRPASAAFYAMLLALTTGVVGVFVALDMFLFYVFWEMMLIPMYFLIGIWGGQGADLRGGQVLPLHRGRLAADAGRDPVPVLPASRR